MSDVPENSPQVTALQAAAEQVRQQLRLAAYDAAAVRELDHFIEAQRPTLGKDERTGVISALGCFLGECLVRTYGAEWAAGPDGTTGVGLANRFFFNPFHLVNTQLNEGQSASVAAFFASVPARLAVPRPTRKGWIS